MESDIPVVAICGATAGLARIGVLNDRYHTSSVAAYLGGQPGYEGQSYYRNSRAVSDGGLVTAGPQSPVQFATQTLRVLGLASDSILQAYESVFCNGDTSAYAAL
ncbi:DJ-1/PfpI family protein [Bifidobacterium mongoliense]|uniref:DJ-1/PfpI family protein n=1 Tax=Bifidobacterium mongoliense TaxID=518643 RepID=UPI001611AEEA